MYEKELKEDWGKLKQNSFKCHTKDCNLNATWSHSFSDPKTKTPLYGNWYCDKCSIKHGNEIMKKNEYTDTELLDWLQSQTRGYGKGWICRLSSTGRGMRLHETSGTPEELSRGSVRTDVRQAIITVIERQKRDKESLERMSR